MFYSQNTKIRSLQKFMLSCWSIRSSILNITLKFVPGLLYVTEIYPKISIIYFQHMSYSKYYLFKMSKCNVLYVPALCKNISRYNLYAQTIT